MDFLPFYLSQTCICCHHSNKQQSHYSDRVVCLTPYLH